MTLQIVFQGCISDATVHSWSSTSEADLLQSPSYVPKAAEAQVPCTQRHIYVRTEAKHILLSMLNHLWLLETPNRMPMAVTYYCLGDSDQKTLEHVWYRLKNIPFPS